jgi:beta-phosphoglucomutase family hydrolase
MNITGVIFDMDGVMVLSENAHWQSWQVAGKQHGLQADYAKFLSCFGRTNPDCIGVMFGELSSDESNAIADDKESAYRDIVRAQVPLAPGLHDLLRALRARGIRTAIGSSAPPENINLILDAGKLRDLFDAVADGSQVKRGKPAPDVFLLAAEKMGIPAKNCAVIEDAPAGIAAAVAAGMLAIGVTTTNPPEKLRAAGAQHLFKDIADLYSSGFFE